MRIAWAEGEARLRVTVPADMAVLGDDLTQFVPLAMMLAMRRGEPLGVDGPVSAKLLGSLATVQEMLSAWSPTFTRVPVRVREAAPAAAPVAGRACGFSRGVDSTYTAACPRPSGQELTHLVYCDGLEPSYSEATSAPRIERARKAADAIGLPLILVTVHTRELLDHVIDHEDSYGAALAMVGLSLAPAIGSFAIASARDYNGLVPRGAHPMLDPLWSSDRVAIEHDSMARDRPEKVRWLVENRPDLLPHLHVCWETDTEDNCGRCTKCRATALQLEIAGGLERSGSFPWPVDVDAIRARREPSLNGRIALNETYRSIPTVPQFDELRDAIAEAIRESARTTVADDPSPHGIFRHQGRLLDAMIRGEPYTPTASGPRAPEPEVGPLGRDWAPAGLPRLKPPSWRPRLWRGRERRG